MSWMLYTFPFFFISLFDSFSSEFGIQISRKTKLALFDDWTLGIWGHQKFVTNVTRKRGKNKQKSFNRFMVVFEALLTLAAIRPGSDAKSLGWSGCETWKQTLLEVSKQMFCQWQVVWVLEVPACQALMAQGQNPDPARYAHQPLLKSLQNINIEK